jgi:ketosteroid isomerase-like protein
MPGDHRIAARPREGDASTDARSGRCMSANADVVRANSAAFNRQDVDGMLELYIADGIAWDRREIGFGEFRGKEAIRSYYQGLFDNVAEGREELEVVSEDGDVVIARCHVIVRLRGGDEDDQADDVTFDYALRVTLTGGLIASLEIFDDVATAASSAPLQP